VGEASASILLICAIQRSIADAQQIAEPIKNPPKTGGFFIELNPK
jgi:hypothetical protein